MIAADEGSAHICEKTSDASFVFARGPNTVDKVYARVVRNNNNIIDVEDGSDAFLACQIEDGADMTTIFYSP
ncbi:hypothetical protein AA100600_2728 [Gluconobacter thailandicus F149-1 = NBRC 100600]|nr:hypothetical protein AA100600_2728 [Gluconobacter thailandicus F149-1 = NBRC 100600]